MDGCVTQNGDNNELRSSATVAINGASPVNDITITISDVGGSATLVPATSNTTQDNEPATADSVDGTAVEAAEDQLPTLLRYNCQRRRGRGRRGNGIHRRGFMVTGLRDLQARHGKWTCFFCCHVTTGTGIIGVWHVLLHVLALSLLSLAVVYPSLVTSSSASGTTTGRSAIRDYNMIGTAQDVLAVNCSRMPCSLATHHGHDSDAAAGQYPHVSPDFPLALGHLLSTHQLNSAEAVSFAVFVTLCTLLVTLLLLFGLHRQNPSHLMPFFFLQVFGFCISSMTMVSYLSYLPNLRHLVEETPSFPFRQLLLSMHTNCLTFAVMIIFIATFMVKAYCINIVWRCYKYLLVCRAAALCGRPTASLLALTDSGNFPPANTGSTIGGRDSNTRFQPAPDHCMHWLMHQVASGRTKAPGASYPEPPPSYDMAMAAPLYSAPVIAANEDADESPLLPRYEDAINATNAVATTADTSAAADVSSLLSQYEDAVDTVADNAAAPITDNSASVADNASADNAVKTV